MDLVVKVTGARKYSFEDDKTGRLVEGVNLWVLQDSDEKDADSLGQIPSKINLPIEAFGKLQGFTFPVNCKLITTQVLTGRGVQTKVSDIAVVK